MPDSPGVKKAESTICRWSNEQGHAPMKSFALIDCLPNGFLFCSIGWDGEKHLRRIDNCCRQTLHHVHLILWETGEWPTNHAYQSKRDDNTEAGLDIMGRGREVRGFIGNCDNNLLSGGERCPLTEWPVTIHRGGRRFEAACVGYETIIKDG